MKNKKILRLFMFMIGVFFFLSSGVSASKYIVIDYDMSNTSDPNNEEIISSNVIGEYGSANTHFKRLSLQSEENYDSFDKYTSANRIVYCANQQQGYPGVNGKVQWTCELVKEDKHPKELAYIMANGYKNSSSPDYTGYYITQMAIWYFTEPGKAFEKFKSMSVDGVNNENAKKIINLINNAKNYNPSLTATIEGNDTKMTATSDGKYYISKVITLSGKDLISNISVTVEGTTGAFVTKDKNATSGNNTGFVDGDKVYIKVPASSIGKNTKIKLNISSAYREYNGTINRCSSRNSDIQDLIDYIPNDNNKTISTSLELSASKNTVVISKTDITGSKEIAGAKLSIKQGNTEVTSWTSTTTPKELLLAPGTYTLEETIAPSGYIKSTSKITFIVKDDGKITVNGKEVTSVVMKNEPIIVYISKKSINGKTELPGAKLKITDKDSKLVKDLDGKELEWTSTTKEASFHLAAGTYYLTEITAPEGYELSETTIEFTVTEDGKVKMDKKDVDGNLIVFTNTPEPTPVKTGSFIIYIIVIGTISVGLATYYVIKKQVI